ncbi:hypothetical protein IH824_16590 [candidate division KSB1 bacterium]|nr:hypothetical protein [candidate division KSB1 bacterium]
MIKINFIANEVALERNDKIRKRATLFYAFAWAMAILLMFLQYQNNQSLIETYNIEMNKLKVEIDDSSPQFRQAVKLYQEMNKSRKSLDKIYASTVEPGFILECLKRLAVKIPPDFWLTEVRLSTTGKKVVADNNKKKPGFKKEMIVRGSLFLNEDGALPKFQSVIQKSEPFSLASCKLNFDEMNVRKLDNKYSHNFEMTFSWLNEIF